MSLLLGAVHGNRVPLRMKAMDKNPADGQNQQRHASPPAGQGLQPRGPPVRERRRKKSTLLRSSVCHHKWQNPDTLKSVGLWRLTSHLHPLPFESPTACLALLKSIGGTFSPLHLSLCTEKDQKRWIFFFFFPITIF